MAPSTMRVRTPSISYSSSLCAFSHAISRIPCSSLQTTSGLRRGRTTVTPPPRGFRRGTQPPVPLPVLSSGAAHCQASGRKALPRPRRPPPRCPRMRKHLPDRPDVLQTPPRRTVSSRTRVAPMTARCVGIFLFMSTRHSGRRKWTCPRFPPITPSCLQGQGDLLRQRVVLGHGDVYDLVGFEDVPYRSRRSSTRASRMSVCSSFRSSTW